MSNIAAEFGLLAGLCKNPDVYFDIQQFLSEDDFTDKAHRQFYVVLQRLLLNSTGQLIVTQPGLVAEATTLGFKDFFEVCRDGELIEACLEHESTVRDVKHAFVQVKRETVRGGYRCLTSYRVWWMTRLSTCHLALEVLLWILLNIRVNWVLI
jgi:hypothetical protein